MGIKIKLTQLVDLNAIRQNLEYVKSRAGVRLLFMVKADAYGHGMCEVAAATEHLVDFFGVATVEEGIILRKAGITKPVLVTIFSHTEASVAIKYGLSVAVFSTQQIVALDNATKKFNKKTKTDLLNELKCNIKHTKAKVHLKLDSGMNRLGAKEENEIKQLVECAISSESVEVEGCYSHLYNINNEQAKKFDTLSKLVKQEFPNALLHLSSSGTVCEHGQDKFDMVRVGLAGYGYGDNHLKPAIRVVSKVVASKKVKCGEHVGYGGYISDSDKNIAIIFGGYADGLIRGEKGFVMLRNQSCKILSVVCMDMTIVETRGFLAKFGECAEFVCDNWNAQQIAEQRGTITYEVLTGFSRERCQKKYLN